MVRFPVRALHLVTAFHEGAELFNFPAFGEIRPVCLTTWFLAWWSGQDISQALLRFTSWDLSIASAHTFLGLHFLLHPLPLQRDTYLTHNYDSCRPVTGQWPLSVDFRKKGKELSRPYLQRPKAKQGESWKAPRLRKKNAKAPRESLGIWVEWHSARFRTILWSYNKKELSLTSGDRASHGNHAD